MFKLGDSAGLLSLKGRFDTVAGAQALQRIQDAKTSMQKMTDATIGIFNKKNTQTSTVASTVESKSAAEVEKMAATGDATSTDVANAQGAEAVQAAADEGKKDIAQKISDGINNAVGSAVDSIKSVEDTIRAAPDKIKGAMSDASDYLAEKSASLCEGNEFLTAAKGYVSDALGTASEFVDNVKSSYCSLTPYPACLTCPNRPAFDNSLTSLEIPDFMGMIEDAISGLVSGVLDAVDSLFGCPGLTDSLVAAIETGDVGCITGPLVNQGMTAVIGTAASMGADAVFGTIASVVPEDLKNTMKDYVGDLTGNTGQSGFKSLAGTMIGLGVAADEIMKTATAVSNGCIPQIPGLSMMRDVYSGQHVNTRMIKGIEQLEGTSTTYTSGIVPGALTFRNTASNTMVSWTSSPALSLAGVAAKCGWSSSLLSDSVNIRSTRTRGYLTSTQLNSLPGCTTSIGSFRRGFVIDNIKTGRQVPGDMKSTVISSITDKLFAA